MSVSQQTIATSRFGYGPHPRLASPRDAGDLMAQIAPGAAFAPKLGGRTIKKRSQMIREFNQLNRTNKNNSNRDALNARRREIEKLHRRDVERRILTPVRSPYGFYERLAWFWADHFAVAGKDFRNRAMVGRFEADAVRPHVGGSFRDLLRAAALHPSMLMFLDQNKSVGPNSKAGLKRGRGLNENLAREILELHTLGVDAGYTQDDVREFAELLTGVTFKMSEGKLVFRRGRAEPGAEFVLGEAYGGGKGRLRDVYIALDDLAAHPDTARHIARKLAVHFVSDEPDTALVAHIEDAFRRSDGDLPTVYAAMLEHPAAWDGYGAKVRQPFDFAVAALRAVDPDEKELDLIGRRAGGERRLHLALETMGQQVYRPPGPQGWEEAASQWITPQGLTARLNWASHLGQVMERRIDPRDLLETALGDSARDATRFAATNAAERWEGIAFVFASPEFNRR